MKVQLHLTFEIPMKPSVDPRVDPAFDAGARGPTVTCARPGVGIIAQTTTATSAVNDLYLIATSPFQRRLSRCCS
jgi:hypothetical protein